jgi:hypothetical protein
MPGIPTAYIEGSFRGRKVAPGDYQFEISTGNLQSVAMAKILPNPHVSIADAEWSTYGEWMEKMESELTEMHEMVNELMGLQLKLKAFLNSISKDEKQKDLHQRGESLLQLMQAWDEDMVQRKSKAYDDVENFPNKFTANYLFLINQTESSIPKVNAGSKKRYAELHTQWLLLKARGEDILNKSIPAFNNQIKAAGFGVLY